MNSEKWFWITPMVIAVGSIAALILIAISDCHL